MTFRHLSVFLAALALAGPVMAQERQWTLDASDQDAYLVFGVPDTDDVGISLWCPIRQGVVNLYLPQGPETIGDKKEIAVTFKAGTSRPMSWAGRRSTLMPAWRAWKPSSPSMRRFSRPCSRPTGSM